MPLNANQSAAAISGAKTSEEAVMLFFGHCCEWFGATNEEKANLLPVIRDWARRMLSKALEHDLVFTLVEDKDATEEEKLYCLGRFSPPGGIYSPLGGLFESMFGSPGISLSPDFHPGANDKYYTLTFTSEVVKLGDRVMWTEATA